MTRPSGTRKGWLIAGLAIAVAAICGFGLVRMTGGDADDVKAVDDPTTTATAEASPSPTPTKKPSAKPTCAGPGDLFNVEGEDVDTLLPDCGATVAPPEAKKTLGLGCGGKYPTIMYKTTTAKSKTTICGTDSSGENIRMVTRPNGAATLDLDADYNPGLDAFVSENDGATYTLEAYNGSLTVAKDGKRDRQDSRDWISLDNEPDYD